MDVKRDSFFLNKKSKPEKSGKIQKKQKEFDKIGKTDLHKNNRQQEFDRNRDVKPGRQEKQVDNQNGAEKKPFDKKTYRLKKYSKKYKLEQWEEQRKKRLMRDYQKELKHEIVTGTYKPVSFDEDVTDGSTGKYVRHPDIIEKENQTIIAKRDPFHRAKEQYNKIKQEKEQKKLEMERIKEEKNQKLQEYKKKKHERFKKLSKKNKKGQPVMTGRLELLLEKIQSK